MNGVDYIEPPVAVMEHWASGLVNIHAVGALVVQYANWAYVYLGYDNPQYKAGEPVYNQAICFMTEACRHRIKELQIDC